MPGNRLAFAIGVGGEDELVGILQRRGDLVDALGGLAVDVPGHGEVALGLDRAVLGRQVADMAIGGEDREVLAQIFVDRFGLGRRFDDDNVHFTVLAASFDLSRAGS